MLLGCYSFIRNGLQCGYPFVEAFLNWKGYVDEFIVVDGHSQDGTRQVLEEIAKDWPQFKVIDLRPDYLDQESSALGFSLGDEFERARQALQSPWQVMVQADCVFHVPSIIALRQAVETAIPGTAAFPLVRDQYRWNWQQNYTRYFLNLCTHKDLAKVVGDGLNCQIQEGQLDLRLLKVFAQYSIADCAWCFWEHLLGKVKSCSEIWLEGQMLDDLPVFPVYNRTLKRSFIDDWRSYEQQQAIPDVFMQSSSPFKCKIPDELHAWFGKTRYDAKQALAFDQARDNTSKTIQWSNKPALLDSGVNKYWKYAMFYLHSSKVASLMKL